MRTWLLSNTFYGTWLPGDERGSVTSVRDARAGDEPGNFRFEHDMPGTPYEDELPGLRDAAAARMTGPPIYFDPEKAEIVLAQFRETATYRGRTLLAVAIMHNHFHTVVQVPDDPDPGRLLADFKAYGSRALNKRYGKPPSDTWWTTRGSKRKLPDDAAVAAGNHYVLFKQPRPLVVWSPDRGAPGASATGGLVLGEPGA
jgi:REP element-mobilizing transposase RayT